MGTLDLAPGPGSDAPWFRVKGGEFKVVRRKTDQEKNCTTSHSNGSSNEELEKIAFTKQGNSCGPANKKQRPPQKGSGLVKIHSLRNAFSYSL